MAKQAKPRSALVIGYHGRGNFGDDIFLEVASHLLGSKGIQKLYVTGRKDTIPSRIGQLECETIYPRVTRIGRLFWVQIMLHAMKCDCIVFCAGTIFQSFPPGMASFALKLSSVLRRELPILALGVSVLPVESAIRRLLRRSFFRLFRVFVVRDVASYDYCVSEGAPPHPVLGGDLSLLWNPGWGLENGHPDLATHARSSNSRKLLFVPHSLRQISSKTREATYSRIFNTLNNWLASNSTYSIEVWPSCADQHDGDVQISEIFFKRFFTEFGTRATVCAPRFNAPQELAGHIQGSAAIITMRMHPGVVGMQCGIPVFQLSYAPKIKDFFTSNGIASNYLADIEGDFSEDLTRFLAHLDNGTAFMQATAVRKHLLRTRRNLDEVIAREIDSLGDFTQKH